MPGKIKVQLVTPKGVLVDKETEEVIAPGIMGEFGVLIGHTPMLTFIKPGVFSYLENDEFTRFVVGTGFCEVLKDSVMVLVEEAYPAGDIDPAVVSSELDGLERELGLLDRTADPAAFERISNKVQVARAKIALAGKS